MSGLEVLGLLPLTQLPLLQSALDALANSRSALSEETTSFLQRLQHLLNDQLTAAKEGQTFPPDLSSEAYRISKEFAEQLNETLRATGDGAPERETGRNLARTERYLEKRFKVLGEDLDRLERSQKLHSSVIALNFNSLPLSRQSTGLNPPIKEETLSVKFDTWIASWLPDLNQDPKQQGLRNSRSAGSSHYVLQSPKYVEWKDCCWNHDETRWLYYVGPPGVGKTVLSSFVIDDLLSTKIDKDVSVGFFYFDYASNHSLAEVLGNILKQVCRSAESSIERLQELFESSQEGTQLTADDILRTLMLLDQKEIFITLDGLDEWPGDHHELISMILRLSTAPRIRLFITSRPFEWFAGIDALKPIPLEQADLKSLETYIIMKIDENPNADFLVSEKSKPAIVEQIQEKCHGSFLWVSLAVPIMFQKLTRFDMKVALEDMPSGPDGLSQMVEKTMFNVLKLQSSAEVRLARHALLWLALGLGQLSPKAICEAAAVDSDSLNLDEDKVPAPRTVERVCLGLVHLDNNTGAIRLLHNSLRDYIIAKQQELFFDGQPFFDGQAEIARTCIHYLFMQDLSDMSDQLEDDSLPSQEGDKLSLLKYSACYWDCHVRKSLPNDTINRMALELLLDWRRMGRILEIRGHISDYPSPTSAMHLAARFGLTAAVAALIEERPMNMYQMDDKGNTLLHEAAKEGWVSVIKLLLEQGARVEVSDNNSRSPLFWAVQKGHTGAVILLLMASNLEGQDNVLGAAAAKGNMEVIHALLKSYPWSEAAVQHALVESVRHNHQQVASLLLDQGLAPTGDALCAAVTYGNEEMIGMLLYRGADPNALNFEGRGVASCAARIGNTRIMDMLIEAGANVDTQDADGITPLFEAIRCSHSKLVKFLLRAGANVQVTQQGTGRTLLHEAARTGDRFVIQELLDAGADLAVYDSDGKLPYELAGTSDIEILLKGNNSPELKLPESQDTVKRERSERLPEIVSGRELRYSDPRDAERWDRLQEEHRRFRDEEMELT